MVLAKADLSWFFFIKSWKLICDLNIAAQNIQKSLFCWKPNRTTTTSKVGQMFIFFTLNSTNCHVFGPYGACKGHVPLKLSIFDNYGSVSVCILTAWFVTLTITPPRSSKVGQSFSFAISNVILSFSWAPRSLEGAVAQIKLHISGIYWSMCICLSHIRLICAIPSSPPNMAHKTVCAAC